LISTAAGFNQYRINSDLSAVYPLKYLAICSLTILAAVLCGPALAGGDTVCSVPDGASELRAGVLAELNAFRTLEGRKAVVFSGTLSSIASDYACVLAGTGHFDHVGPDGSTLTDRVASGGYRYCRIAENLAKGQRSAQEVVDGWANSPGHRKNMALADVVEIGLGVARAGGDAAVAGKAGGDAPSGLSALAAQLNKKPAPPRAPRRESNGPLVWVLLLGDEC
jgi:hypothetical protein